MNAAAQNMKIKNGTFTVSSPSGEHRTFKVSTWKKADQLTRSIALLVGCDNDESYKGFGFVQPDGRIVVWKACRGGQFDKLARMFEDLFSENSRFKARGMTVLESRECMRCGRTLTTPSSIENGIGPECSKKF